MNQTLTRSRVLALAVPVMLAQAATASTGVVDTTLMGMYGTQNDLGAVGVASVAINFLYWAFGFLRMATTGLTAQAQGADDVAESQSILTRSCLIGGGFGLLMLALSPLLALGVFEPFDTTQAVKSLAQDYWGARIWGAPAVLIGYGITGWLLGTGRTRQLLAVQVVMNLLNAVLSIWFVSAFGYGTAGLGAGTAISEWVALLVGVLLVRKHLTSAHLFNTDKLKALFAANRDILVRTLALLFSFAWFVNSGARLGTATLAGNEVLMQFVSVSAFILDGFAFVAEKEIGEAYGAKDRARLIFAMRVTTELALGFAALISLLYFLGGDWVIARFVHDPQARQVALEYLPFCAVIPVVGLACWQLDGFFLGATQGKALRNAALVTTVAYLATDMTLRHLFGNTGVWVALLSMYIYRACALGVYVPSLLAETSVQDKASEE